jgi:glycosyltransferase involved in cell wall biosynthesis
VKISCIIPCYNLGRFLDTAVESALSQTKRFDEIIVIDDGSTDDTQERLTKLHPSVFTLSTKNQGYAKTRNLGALMAKADVYVFLDADDWLFSDYVANVLPEFYHDHSIGVVCPEVEADGVTVAGGVWPAPENDSLPRLLQGNYVWAASAIRASAFWDVGGFMRSMEPAADWALWVKVRSHGWHISGVHKTLWHWRDRPEGLHMTIDDNEIRQRMKATFPELYAPKSLPTI